MAPPCGKIGPLQYIGRHYSNKSGMRKKFYVVDLINVAGQFIHYNSFMEKFAIKCSFGEFNSV